MQLRQKYKRDRKPEDGKGKKEFFFKTHSIQLHFSIIKYQKGRVTSEKIVENVTIPLTTSLSESTKSAKKGEVAALGMTDSMRITFFVVISTLLKHNDTISMTTMPTAIPKIVRKKVPEITGRIVSFLSIIESESPTVKSIAGIVMFAIEPMLCVSHAGSFIP